MSQQRDMPKVPRLRFPEFSGEWRRNRIDWFLRKAVRTVDVDEGATYREIGVRSHGKGIFHKEECSGASLGDKRVFWVEPNALVLNIVFAWEQAVALTSEQERGFIASHRFPMFINRDDRADTRFARDFFLRGRGKYLLGVASPGGAGRNKTLGQSDFAELHVAWPEQAEQAKIADFLGAATRRIELLQQKEEALLAYKSGAIQKIFSGRARFVTYEGSPYPEWRERRVGQLFRWVGTNNLSREMLTNEPQAVQNIHYGDIHGRFSSRFKQSQAGAPFIRPEAMPKIPEESFCRPGDIVIADASEDYADIGKAIEIIEVRPNSIVAGLHTYIARPISADLALGFSGYLFQTQQLRRQIMRIAQGISVLGVSKPHLAKLTLMLPHVDEQRKIAGFLFSIDDKIDAVSRQLAAMKSFKRALLQQLFV